MGHGGMVWGTAVMDFFFRVMKHLGVVVLLLTKMCDYTRNHIFVHTIKVNLGLQ